MPKPEDLLPVPPEEGPPLPDYLKVKWPDALRNIMSPPLEIRLHIQREGMRRINEAISIYEGKREKLPKWAKDRLDELYRLRDLMVKSEAQMRRRRK